MQKVIALKAKSKKNSDESKPSPYPGKAQSKVTIRTFEQTACLKMARFYKERIGAEVLSEKPRYNKDLDMWEFDVLKDD